MKLAKVCNLDVLTEPSLEGVNGCNSVRCDCAVIYMHSNDNKNVRGLGVFEENGLIDFALLEAEGAEDEDKLLIPSPASLFEAIERLPKP